MTWETAYISPSTISGAQKCDFSNIELNRADELPFLLMAVFVLPHSAASSFQETLSGNCSVKWGFSPLSPFSFLSPDDVWAWGRLWHSSAVGEVHCSP